MKGRRDANTTYTDLSTVLRRNNPSQAEKKRQNDSFGSVDPVVDHLMGSKALMIVIWGSVASVLSLGLAVMAMAALFGRSQNLKPGGVRATIIMLGVPAVLAYVPVATAIAMLCSRRLR